MVSTLKLTKIQIPNSDSDVLSFNSSTGVMTFHKDIKGEGTATTNLQQGLCKQWISFDGGESGVTGDSFNTTSFTDVGAGIMTITIANDMASVNYTVSGMARAADNAGVRAAHMSFPANATSRTAGTYTVSTQANNTSQRDCEEQVNHIFGDLA